jgi:transcriptional regulator with XRE-family HTH domain
MTAGIVERIKDVASEKHLSIAHIERKTDLGNGTIARWSNMTPSSENVVKVADFLGVTTDYLLKGKK